MCLLCGAIDCSDYPDPGNWKGTGGTHGESNCDVACRARCLEGLLADSASPDTLRLPCQKTASSRPNRQWLQQWQTSSRRRWRTQYESELRSIMALETRDLMDAAKCGDLNAALAAVAAGAEVNRGVTSIRDASREWDDHIWDNEEWICCTAPLALRVNDDLEDGFTAIFYVSCSLIDAQHAESNRLSHTLGRGHKSSICVAHPPLVPFTGLGHAIPHRHRKLLPGMRQRKPPGCQDAP